MFSNLIKTLSLRLEEVNYFPALGRFVPNPSLREGKWHLDLVVSLAAILRPQNYLEVGIYRCGLFNRMIPYCQTLTGVDLDANAGSYMESTSKVNFVNMSSHDYWKTSHGNLFDFIMIDANHSKESVEEDFHNGLRLLGEDGLLLLHDTYPESEEATISDRCDDGYLFIGEASLDSRDYEMVTLPRHPGLTICRKRSKQVPWMQ